MVILLFLLGIWLAKVPAGVWPPALSPGRVKGRRNDRDAADSVSQRFRWDHGREAGQMVRMVPWAAGMGADGILPQPGLCWRIGGSGDAGFGLRNQAVKGIKWSSLHHKSLLESFHFPALVPACSHGGLFCTFKGVASAGVSHSDGSG